MRGAAKRILSLVVLVTLVGASAARGELDVTGRWKVVILENEGSWDFVQSRTTLTVNGHVGTIDLETGFMYVLDSGPDCQLFFFRGIATDESMSGLLDTAFPGPFGCRFAGLEFTATRLHYCGDGIVDPGESCDDGNAEWGDCCDPPCVQIPAGWPCADDGLACTNDRCDAAGVCQHPLRPAGEVCRASTGGCDVVERCDGASPACPADVSPDGDGDGQPDSCDSCPSGRPLGAAKLKAGTYDGTSGNDTLKVSGRTTLDAGAVLDPVAHGLVIDVHGDAGGAITAVVPAGAENPLTRQGWKASSNGTSWTFRSSDPALLVTKAQVKRSGSVVTVKASGRRTSFATALPQAPVRLAVALDGSPARACGEATFNDASGPLPRCAARGTSLVCK